MRQMDTKTKLLAARTNLERQIAAVDKAMEEIAVSGTTSATLSAGGGSKSYTRMDLDKLQRFRDRLVDRLVAVLQALRGEAPGLPRHISIVRM